MIHFISKLFLEKYLEMLDFSACSCTKISGVTFEFDRVPFSTQILVSVSNAEICLFDTCETKKPNFLMNALILYFFIYVFLFLKSFFC